MSTGERRAAKRSWRPAAIVSQSPPSTQREAPDRVSRNEYNEFCLSDDVLCRALDDAERTLNLRSGAYSSAAFRRGGGSNHRATAQALAGDLGQTEGADLDGLKCGKRRRMEVVDLTAEEHPAVGSRRDRATAVRVTPNNRRRGDDTYLTDLIDLTDQVKKRTTREPDGEAIFVGEEKRRRAETKANKSDRSSEITSESAAPQPSSQPAPRTQQCSSYSANLRITSHDPFCGGPISLTQMVQEDSHDVHDRGQNHVAGMLMIQRRNLEAYVNRKCLDFCLGKIVRRPNTRSLMAKIDFLGKCAGMPPDLIRAMHTVRDYGNAAAHCKSLPGRGEAEQVVQNYLHLKNRYERGR